MKKILLTLLTLPSIYAYSMSDINSMQGTYAGAIGKMIGGMVFFLIFIMVMIMLRIYITMKIKER